MCACLCDYAYAGKFRSCVNVNMFQKLVAV